MAENPEKVVKVNMGGEIRGVEKIISGIRARGFAVELTQDGGLAVTPASQLQPHDREVIRTNKAAIVDYLTAANDPHAQDPTVTAQDAYCWPNGSAANGAELTLMSARLERFARIGMDVDQAEKLADRLKDRDREHDDRRACVECSSLNGCPGNWRCMSFRARGARDPGLPHDLTTMLQRCPTYTSGQPVIDVYASVKALPPKPPLQPQQYHPLNAEEKQASRDYHAHHFGCPKCRVAGQNRGERCQRGAELWSQYQGETTK